MLIAYNGFGNLFCFFLISFLFIFLLFGQIPPSKKSGGATAVVTNGNGNVSD